MVSTFTSFFLTSSNKDLENWLSPALVAEYTQAKGLSFFAVIDEIFIIAPLFAFKVLKKYCTIINGACILTAIIFLIFCIFISSCKPKYETPAELTIKLKFIFFNECKVFSSSSSLDKSQLTGIKFLLPSNIFSSLA